VALEIVHSDRWLGSNTVAPLLASLADATQADIAAAAALLLCWA
jgi:hypothetical protein